MLRELLKKKRLGDGVFFLHGLKLNTHVVAWYNANAAIGFAGLPPITISINNF
jgi:hypothetical protein